ncbi:hypothetical protein D3C87_1759250 [compost metagenome]
MELNVIFHALNKPDVVEHYFNQSVFRMQVNVTRALGRWRSRPILFIGQRLVKSVQKVFKIQGFEQVIYSLQSEPIVCKLPVSSGKDHHRFNQQGPCQI